ncbi:nitroreductase family protein [Pseudothauera rhizosphaerae]|uniref:SagB/ThcOx family dehydrogenase n=1 Tax=Pseudothauera rhizosphaerae TaxID=2565932 RepID=A0A4V3W9I2_9RHOO|nr:nitroreductase family protein [Pseudothauera rhizosphaerae]THF55369.1 SagB/ThcOx family dehydrogenase [Pseudothauera rhizosphaerae]
MDNSAPPDTSAAAPLPAADVVRIYHRRTAHCFDRYAPGPATLDWDAQPAPFRRYADAPVTALPLIDTLLLHPQAAPDGLAAALARSWAALGEPAPALAPDRASLGALLQLAFGVTAWKSFGPERWAVRANPSSGNLHPVEAWVISRGIAGLTDGVHHYRPDDHALELRAADPAPAADEPAALLLALSSVMWREAWKYGERAFRYCQLDVGHGQGALKLAAALLGWRLDEQRHVGHATLAARLGLDRAADYTARRAAETELEEPEILLAVGWPAPPPAVDPQRLREAAARAHWSGRASEIDPRPHYRWPIVQEVAAATRRDDRPAPAAPQTGTAPAAAPAGAHGPRAIDLILRRRSAQRFDAEHEMSTDGLIRLLAAAGHADGDGLPPLDVLVYVQRVAGLAPGLYLLPDGPDGALTARLADTAPALPGTRLIALQTLEPQPLRRLVRSLHCHQDIAANACIAFGFLAALDEALAADPASYRDLHRAAGQAGQRLYLAAESLDLRGTGIGCFFDDPVLESAGLADSGYRPLYHFTVGRALDDPRIETTPPYPPERLAEDHRP